MKYRAFSILTLLALLLVSVVPLAAQDDTAEGFPLTVTDGLGRELTFEEPPERIVTYYNDSFGMLATLGVMPVAQSVNPEMLSDPIYFGEAGMDIPTITYDDGPDLEEVAAAEPDLVLVFSEEEVQALEGIAPAFVTPDPTNLEELYDAVRLYGELLGLEGEAEEVITTFDDRLSAYQVLASADLSVLKLGVMGENSFWVSTLDDPLCQVLNTLADCGWESPMETEFWGYEGTAESVLNLNPDVIILNNWTDNDYDAVTEQLNDNPLWGELDAVQNERVLSTPGYDNPIASSLPALQKFLDIYMPLLYPEALPDGPLTNEQVQEILAEQEADESTSDTGFPVTVVDGDGEELTFETAPERIVCLDNKCVEDMAFIGVMPYAVGAPNPYNIANDPVNFGAAAADLIQISSSDGGPNFEQVAAAEPDLIVGWSELRPSAEGIAPFFSLIYGDGTLEGAFRDTRALAAMLGRSEEVEEKIANLTTRIDAYDELIPDDTSILITFTDGDLRQFWLPTQEGFGACWVELIAECASIGEAEFSTGGYGDYEALLALDPDVIVLQDFAQDPEAMTETLNTLDENALWRELSAVKNDKIFVTTPTTSRFTSPQGASNALEYLIPRIFPDIFPDGPLTDEQVQEILTEAETE